MTEAGTHRPFNAGDIHLGQRAKSEAAADSRVPFRDSFLCGFQQIIVRLAHMAWCYPPDWLLSESESSMAGGLESCLG